ncbi:DUF2169 family type VI secretion system accessory protein [Nannocystaceae bacterium ST9]
MPHPNIENATAFVAEGLPLVDEHFAPVLTLVVKATFDIQPYGVLALAAEQAPLYTAGLLNHPDASTESSYRYEPEVAFCKPATDVVLVGHAHAPGGRATVMDVGFRVGPVHRAARVFGDRMWFRATGGIRLSAPVPFERMPIVYERAFGGWDHGGPTPSSEVRNPVGRGFVARTRELPEGLLAPNLELFDFPIQSVHDRPPPAGFGFVSPHWHPRMGLAGTYDQAWHGERAPLLPLDFDRRHLNAASPGLVAPGFLVGDERVLATGLSPEGRLDFRLPGLRAPTARVRLDDMSEHRPTLDLDTVIVDLDARKLFMLWRACVPTPGGPHRVTAIAYDCPDSKLLPRAEHQDIAGQAANC